MIIMDGYTRTGKHVEIILENNRVYIRYTASGRKVKWNDEYYTLSDWWLLRAQIQDAGIRT